MTIAVEDMSADEDNLLMLFASAYCCVVSSPLILESEEHGTRTPMIRRRRKTIEGLLLEYGERNFERAYRMSFASFSHLHTAAYFNSKERHAP
jgi:hypothetical protein